MRWIGCDAQNDEWKTVDDFAQCITPGDFNTRKNLFVTQLFYEVKKCLTLPESTVLSKVCLRCDPDVYDHYFGQQELQTPVPQTTSISRCVKTFKFSGYKKLTNESFAGVLGSKVLSRIVAAHDHSFTFVYVKPDTLRLKLAVTRAVDEYAFVENEFKRTCVPGYFVLKLCFIRAKGTSAEDYAKNLWYLTNFRNAGFD